jgi:hypothetical protein
MGVLVAILIAAGLAYAWSRGMLDQPLRALAPLAHALGLASPTVPPTGQELREQCRLHCDPLTAGNPALRSRAQRTIITAVEDLEPRIGSLSTLPLDALPPLVVALKAEAVRVQPEDPAAAAGYVCLALWLEASQLPDDPAARGLVAQCWESIAAALALSDRESELLAVLDLPTLPRLLRVDRSTGLEHEINAVEAQLRIEIDALADGLTLDAVPALAGFTQGLARLVAPDPALVEPIAQAAFRAVAADHVAPLLRAARFDADPRHYDDALARGAALLDGPAAEAFDPLRPLLDAALTAPAPIATGALHRFLRATLLPTAA